MDYSKRILALEDRVSDLEKQESKPSEPVKVRRDAPLTFTVDEQVILMLLPDGRIVVRGTATSDPRLIGKAIQEFSAKLFGKKPENTASVNPRPIGDA